MAEIKVAVNGILGRMGSTVLGAVTDEPGMVPVGGADLAASAGTSIPLPDGSGSVPAFNNLSDLLESVEVDVVVDFTNGEAAAEAMRAAIENGVRVVSGSTGVSAEDLEHARALSEERGVGVISASNFALGAVLLGHLAGIASQYFEYADLLESHHEAKVDAPSGTALSIAESMARGKGGPFTSSDTEKETLAGVRGGTFSGINVHSARMQGRVARHEVVFGAQGQTLTMIHDSIDRGSFMPGVITAVRHVMTLDSMVVGLDKVLGLAD